MDELLVPLVPSILWLIACAIVILFVLVIFGYHLYQRKRIQAILGDIESVGAIEARKDSLTHELEEMKRLLEQYREELLKSEADRRKQELFRAELGALERNLDDARHENARCLDNLASLDNQLARRRQALGKIDAEISALEKRREELAPLEESLQDMRLQLERGNIKLAQLAEQELKVAALMHQARDLAREIEDLTHTLEPLRHEKHRLRIFIEQARHSSAVKNEQILDQKKRLLSLSEREKELVSQITILESHCARLDQSKEEKSAEVQVLQARKEAEQIELEAVKNDSIAKLDKAIAEKQSCLDDILAQIQSTQAQLGNMLLRRDERAGEVASLAGRAAVLQREIEMMQPRRTISQGRRGKKGAKKPARHGPARKVSTRLLRSVQANWSAG